MNKTLQIYVIGPDQSVEGALTNQDKVSQSYQTESIAPEYNSLASISWEDPKQCT